MVDFNEAYRDTSFKEELKRNMEVKHYPPRYQYEIADLTKNHSFFTVPKILEYNLKGGKIDTMDGEDEINGEIVIPSLNAVG